MLVLSSSQCLLASAGGVGQIVVWSNVSVWICSIGSGFFSNADYFSALRDFVSLVLELSGYLGLLLALEPTLTGDFGASAVRSLLFSFYDFPRFC